MTQSFVWLYEGVVTIVASILVVGVLTKILKYLE